MTSESVDCPTCNTRFPVVANGVRAETTSWGVRLVETICHHCDAHTIWRVGQRTYLTVRRILEFVDGIVVLPFVDELAETDLLVAVLKAEEASA